MSTRDAPWAYRLTALLRAKAVLLGASAVGTLATVAYLSHWRPESPRSVLTVLGFASFLVGSLVPHGTVAHELRSGVALLWLQKPVAPLGFYGRRGLEVVSLSVLLMLALVGASALLAALLAAPETGRTILSGSPTLVLLTISLSLLVFAFSAWGTSLDAFLAFFVFYSSALTGADGGLLGETVRWVGFPLEQVAAVGGLLQREVVEDVAVLLARLGCFLLFWGGLAALGIALTTRSPLPRESSR